MSLWQEHLSEKTNKLAITPQESLSPGSSEIWPFWACLNRLRTAMGLCKINLVKRGYKHDGDISCFCGGTNNGPYHFLSAATNTMHKTGPHRPVTQCKIVQDTYELEVT